MNLLLIDVGNSNIVTACMAFGKKKFQERSETKRSWDQILMEEEFRRIMELHQLQPGDVDGIVISSVVPELNAVISSALRRLTGHTAVIADLRTISLRVENYEKALLGRDRLVDALAAKSLYGAPVMVYDLGTCSTMSIVNKNGAFSGGMISAGVQLQLDAEAERTAQLPKLKADSADTLVGNDTVSCMLNGAVIGTAAMIDGIYERVKEAMPDPDWKLVLTGGLSSLVIPWMKSRAILEPDLLLKGMAIIYEENARPMEYSEGG